MSPIPACQPPQFADAPAVGYHCDCADGLGRRGDVSADPVQPQFAGVGLRCLVQNFPPLPDLLRSRFASSRERAPSRCRDTRARSEPPRVSWIPSGCNSCCRSKSTDDSIPFLMCLRSEFWNISTDANTSWWASARALRVRRPELRHLLAQPVNLLLLRLDLPRPGRTCCGSIDRSRIDLRIAFSLTSRSRAACATAMPRSFTNLAATSLNSRPNFLLGIPALQFRQTPCPGLRETGRRPIRVYQHRRGSSVSHRRARDFFRWGDCVSMGR